jgi:hypothetical protein
MPTTDEDTRAPGKAKKQFFDKDTAIVVVCLLLVVASMVLGLSRLLEGFG